EQDEFKDELDRSKELIEQLEMDKKTTKFELGYFKAISAVDKACLLYTSEAADDLTRVDLGCRLIFEKQQKIQ
ncbi:hypothetical protein QNH95_18885, partial [Klebsiella pneumoniae]|uniref:hypothetical protein n=1 Tax=Klebsiella pneumoniae TaxID=573 RepID=UPI00255254CC